MAKSLILVPLAALLTGGACVSALVLPGDPELKFAAATWPGTTLKDLQDGRETYIAKCGGCHSLKAPTDLPPEAWPRQVEKMAERAKLTDEEKFQVRAYLASASASAQPEHAER